MCHLRISKAHSACSTGHFLGPRVVGGSYRRGLFHVLKRVLGVSDSLGPTKEQRTLQLQTSITTIAHHKKGRHPSGSSFQTEADF